MEGRGRKPTGLAHRLGWALSADPRVSLGSSCCSAANMQQGARGGAAIPTVDGLVQGGLGPLGIAGVGRNLDWERRSGISREELDFFCSQRYTASKIPPSPMWAMRLGALHSGQMAESREYTTSI